MIETGVGRLLGASLHQGIADLLPERLEFYEGWLNPSGLRDGRIGLAPMAAVLSFLRQEGAVYRLVSARAGEYAAEWTVSEFSKVHRAIIRAVPPRVRARLAMRIVGQLVRRTYGGSRGTVRWRRGQAALDLHNSIFCSLREPSPAPMCEFYAAATRRLLKLVGVDAEVSLELCRATGSDHCMMTVLVRPAVAEPGRAGSA